MILWFFSVLWRILWGFFELSRIIGNFSDLSRIFLRFLGLSRTLWGLSGLSKTLWGLSDLSRIIRCFSGLNRILWSCWHGVSVDVGYADTRKHSCWLVRHDVIVLLFSHWLRGHGISVVIDYATPWQWLCRNLPKGHHPPPLLCLEPCDMIFLWQLAQM